MAFSIVSGPASLSGNNLSLSGAGVVTVRAAQPGDATHAAAATVDQSFTVTANFDSWAQGRFTAGELSDTNISGPNAIYGQDGLPNLVKYALGLEPKQNITAGLPDVSVQAATGSTPTRARPVSPTSPTRSRSPLISQTGRRSELRMSRYLCGHRRHLARTLRDRLGHEYLFPTESHPVVGVLILSD